jgi:DNA-binding transcriptional LysR family regulator
MDRFAAMSAFVQVVEQGSFARAAERLSMSTSAVSRHVADLESHLDARLLNRTTRKLSLSETGQAYFERAVQLLSDLGEAEAMAESTHAAPRGTIKLSSSATYGVMHLAPAIAAFQRQFPDVKFDVSLSERFVDLVDEGLDLAIRIGDLGDTNLIAKKIGETELIACASPQYLAAHGTPKHPRDLVKHNCFSYAYLATKNHWRFTDRKGEVIEVPIEGSLKSNSGELAIAMASRGAGIALEPCFMFAAALAEKRVVRVLENFRGRNTGIHVVYPARKHLSNKVRSFVDFLHARYLAQRGGQAAVKLPEAAVRARDKRTKVQK